MVMVYKSAHSQKNNRLEAGSQNRKLVVQQSVRINAKFTSHSPADLTIKIPNSQTHRQAFKQIFPKTIGLAGINN